MFKLVNRSKSMKNLRVFAGRGGDGGASEVGSGKMREDPAGSVVAASHGPESPVLGEPGIVSDSQQQTATLPQNASNTLNGAEPPSPVSSSAGAATTDDAGNRYVRRPLPHPPPLSRPFAGEATMDRPSTSAGPGSSSNSRVMFGGLSSSSAVALGNTSSFSNKRMSRDDLYINTTSTKSRSFKSYHIPIRGKPPSPNYSPRSRTPEATIPVRTQTPESMDGHASEAPPIGMALGSPGFPPPTSYAADWKPQVGGSDFQFRLEDPHEPPAKKKKKGLFGLFGGKKEAKNKEKRVQDDDLRPSFESRPTTSSGKKSSQLDRSVSEKKLVKQKPMVIRSQTAPMLDSPIDFKEPKEPKTPRPSLSHKASTKSIRDGIKKSDISAPVPIPAVPGFPSININGAPPPPGSGLLDVEIPSIKMDRYSVMFSGILQTQGLGGPANRNSQSNLLARRQATLDKLRTINDAIIREEEAKLKAREEALMKPVRRATSPMHAKSPSFSLFPTPPTNKAPGAPKLSPLSRSNTSPANLPSPAKATFAQSSPPRRPAVTTIPAARTETPESRSRSEMSQQSQDISIVLEPTVAKEKPAAVAVSTKPSSEPAPQATIRDVADAFPMPAQRPAASRRPAPSQDDAKSYRRERPGSRGRPTRSQGERSRSREPSARKPVPSAQGVAVAAQPQPQPAASKVPQPRAPVSQRQERQTQPPQQPQQQQQPQQPQAQIHAEQHSRLPQPIHTAASPPRAAPPPQTQQPQQAQQSNFSPDKSALILDSPTYDFESSNSGLRGGVPMASISANVHRDPTWQMMSPPPSSTASSQRRSPSNASSVQTVQTHVTKPSIDEPDMGLKNAVEVSIARQISLSQQQRRLLRPLETNVTPRPGTATGGGGGARDGSPASSSGRSPARKLAVGKNERLGEAKTGTPTVVSRDGFDAGAAGNRRSERIVVEGY